MYLVILNTQNFSASVSWTDFWQHKNKDFFTNMEGKWFCAVVIHANFAKFALEWYERKKVGANLPKESQKLRNVHSLF